jgi:hypothetical protein
MAANEYKSASAKWRALNPEKQKAASLNWRKNNLERSRENDRNRRRKVPREQNRAEAAKWRAANPDRAHAITLVARIRLRSKRKGIDFEPSILDKLNDRKEHCPCCHLPFENYKYGSSATNRYTSRLPSLDRFDNLQGYTDANVRVICSRCNSLKSNATLQELESIVTYMRS